MRNTATLLLIIALLSACKDNYLERLPDTQVGESQDYFNTQSGLEIYSNSFYNYIDYNSIVSDQNSDNMEFAVSPANIRYANYTLPTALGSGGWNWTQLRNINYFIERCNASTVESSVKNEYLALAKFFRAKFYLEKVQSFGDVPWYSTPINTEDQESLYKGRDSRILVMDSVLNDINFAIEYLPETKYKNRISRYTALAYKSRICLFEGTWRKYHKEAALEGADRFLTEAADAAKTLMDSGVYNLYSTGDTESDFRNLFQADEVSTDEVILAYSFAPGIYHAYTAFFTVASRGTAGATRSLISDFGMADGRSFYEAYPQQAVRDQMTFSKEMQNRDPRLTQSIVHPGYIRTGTSIVSSHGDFVQNRTGYQITKRVGAPSEDDAGDSRDVIMLRYAEVLLNYAEARAELGLLDQHDLDLSINLLRRRVGLSDRSFPLQTDPIQLKRYIGTKDPNILEVRRERRIELAFEGFRANDMRRWAEGHLFRSQYEGVYIEGLNKPIDMDGDGTYDVYFYDNVAPTNPLPNVLYVEFQGQNGLSNGNKGRIVPYNQQTPEFQTWEYLNPIPAEELLVNENLVQNPGWDNL
ncbi:MAG: RagB/SusD family nutrient uptake outer membrane protein [Sphingobacterium sp.]